VSEIKQAEKEMQRRIDDLTEEAEDAIYNSCRSEATDIARVLGLDVEDIDRLTNLCTKRVTGELCREE